MLSRRHAIPSKRSARVRPRSRCRRRRRGAELAWLVLFVVATLFGQWPLRELLGTGHILANDFGQIAHAAVFAIGIAYALRWDGHVRLDVFYHRLSPRGRALIDLAGSVAFIVPWAAMVLWFSWA